MTRKEIGDKLRGIMRASSQEEVDWSAVTEQSQIADLGFDSLSILDLVYDIQQGFGVEFEAEQLTAVRTVADLVTFLEQRLAR